MVNKRNTRSNLFSVSRQDYTIIMYVHLPCPYGNNGDFSEQTSLWGIKFISIETKPIKQLLLVSTHTIDGRHTVAIQVKKSMV